MRAHVVKELLEQNTLAASKWRAATGLEANQLEKGHFMRSVGFNCTLVCKGDNPYERHLCPYEAETERSSSRVGSALRVLMRWKAIRSKMLARSNWSSVASLLFDVEAHDDDQQLGHSAR